ncbi:MAG: cell envelope integrity protein TolA, partial [Pseudomonadota bacterium]|nr:cell envelope integrity protein TolA [Pseudomonadota bacterium]
KPKPKPEPKPKPKPKPEPKPQPRPEPEPQPEPETQTSSSAFDDLLREEMEAMEQQKTETVEGDPDSQSRQELDEIAQYRGLIQQTMKRYWVLPPSARNDMVVTLDISLLPGGEVRTVSIDESSGNRAFDDAALQAVQKAGRFSVPPDPQLFDRHFRKFKMRFKPSDLRY